MRSSLFIIWLTCAKTLGEPSCHVPFFVVYPGTALGTHDRTFFDHYSLTRTIEDFFGLYYLAHAADSQTNSLVGHFGLVK